MQHLLFLTKSYSHSNWLVIGQNRSEINVQNVDREFFYIEFKNEGGFILSMFCPNVTTSWLNFISVNDTYKQFASV